MQPRLLLAYMRQLPVLQAADSLRRVTEIAVASGRMKRDEAGRVLSRWRRLAEGNAGERVEPVDLSSADGARALAALGLTVERSRSRPVGGA